VSISLRPRRALLNDINKPLINFYRWVKRGLVIDMPMVQDKEVYRERRRAFNEMLASGQFDTAEAAQLFYYLVKTSFRGLAKFRGRGFNNSFEGRKPVVYETGFEPYRRLFAEWEFVCNDFQSIALMPGDFVYADPPYDDTDGRYISCFTWGDHVRLAEWLSTHDGPVVLSNEATERVVDLYTGLGYKCEVLKRAQRVIHSGSFRELIAWHNISLRDMQSALGEIDIESVQPNLFDSRKGEP
jgi:DNA adenine methylase